MQSDKEGANGRKDLQESETQVERQQATRGHVKKWTLICFILAFRRLLFLTCFLVILSLTFFLVLVFGFWFLVFVCCLCFPYCFCYFSFGFPGGLLGVYCGMY